MKKSIGEIVEKLERERISRNSRLFENTTQNKITLPKITQSGKGIFVCKGIWFSEVEKFLGGVLSWTDLESLRAGIESSSNIGDKWIITEQTQLPIGSSLFERHTGEIAEFVGPGNGVEGSSWNFTQLKSGTLVSFDGMDAPWYIIVDEVETTNFSSNGGTGKIAIPYIDIDIVGSPPDIVRIFNNGYSGVKTNRSKFADRCRSFQLLYTEDYSEYKALPTIYQESIYINLDITTTGLFPPEAIGFGVRWLRGGEQFDRTY